ADAPGAAPQPYAGVAGPEAAVLELPAVRRREAAEALPVPTPGAALADLRPVGPAAGGPRPVAATTVNPETCGMRQSPTLGIVSFLACSMVNKVDTSAGVLRSLLRRQGAA